MQPRRIARWAGALALAVMPVLALAQDGQRGIGPPVTTPKTDKNKTGTLTTVPPRVGSEVLTPVPASASDPAPPGTRVQRVDAAAPPAGVAAPAAPAGAPANVPGLAEAAALPAGVLTAEGIIVDKSIKRGGKDLPDEQIRFTLDPSRNWGEFAAPGSVAATAPARGDAKGRKNAATKPIDLVVTKRSGLFTFARTPDGRVVRDPVNPNAADLTRTRTGLTTTGATPPVISPTNFTVLKPGQFVAVRYRRAGTINEVVGLSVIVLPTTPTASNVPTTTRPAVSPTTAPGTAPARTGTAPASGRVPRIPATPTVPAVGPM